MIETVPTAVPGDAEHPSLALVNSLSELPGGKRLDELASPESAKDWLAAHDLIAPEAELHEYCRGRIVGLREDLRALFIACVTGERPTPEAVQALNSALTSAPGALLLRFDPAMGFSRSAEHPVTQVVDHAMAIIAEDAAALITGDEALLLAPCEAASCLRFFLRLHARRQWCSNRCGDRVRAARAYARKRAALTAGAN